MKITVTKIKRELQKEKNGGWDLEQLDDKLIKGIRDIINNDLVWYKNIKIK